MSRTMKDSGIPWIGEIPSHWRLYQTSTLFHEHKEKNNGLKEKNLLSLSYGQIRRKDINSSEGLLPQSFEAYNIIDKGDIVFRLTDLQNDKRSLRTGLCQERGIITSAYVSLRANTEIDSRYFHYIYHSYDICKVFYGMGGGVRQGMNYDDLKKLLVFLPPIPEQKSIADFLDKKCGEIDEMISLQEKIVEELKAYKQAVITEAACKGLNPDVLMKDSGIEWIGQIPEGWRAKRLKFSCEVFGRIGFRGYTTDDIVADGEGAITLSPSNMKEMTMDFSKRTYLSWNKYNESPEIMVYEGDVLMVKTGSSYGKCSYVDYLPIESTINPQIVVFKNHKDNAKYIAYYFQTPMALAYIKTSVVGGTIPTIAQEKIMNYYFAFPPREEQNAIVDYLDTKCTEIDALVSLKQSKIDALKEYKKSIIYEYITGKKEING